MSPGRGRAWLRAVALCLGAVALDQAAKAVVEGSLVPGERVAVAGPLDIVLVHNSGIAFGLASGGGALLIAVTGLALAVVAYLFGRDPERPWMWVAVGLLAGGAIGNLIDRVRVGEVTDYLDFLAWPPFNLADVAINVGVAVLVIAYLGESRGEAARGRAGG